LRTNLSLALPHEMITPLNGIFGLAQLLSTEAATLTPEEVAEYGTNILESAERLHRTVRNFVLYGQLEMQASDAAAVAALRQAMTATVGQLLEARARHFAQRAGRAGDLRLELGNGTVAVGFDLLTSLVDGLLDNAFKFSPAGTEVVVSSKTLDMAHVISITDHGLGMEPAQIAQIGAYAQFNRRQNEQQGSGLGLAIARRIAELHGGQLTIESQKGRGTTVSIRLPLGVLSP
jgi:signal transduction histidine kinase